MGRKPSDSTVQTTAKSKVSGSSSSKPPKLVKASGGTPKPLSAGSKKRRTVESDEVEVDGPSREPPTKKKKPTAAVTATSKNATDEAKPSTSKKGTRSQLKPVKSPLTAAKPTDGLHKKPAGKKQKAVAQPVEADSEESEEEWVGFGEGHKDEDESGDTSSSDEEELLHGLSSDDDDQDSSDEEIEIPGIDVSKLPTIAKDDKTVQQKLEKAKLKPAEDRGVVYLGRIPHGFYEDQMKSYFTQFGDVTRLRLSRNKKTGRSKHYGFIEFDSSRVAEIVAETMDNYLLMGHILKCKLIPKSEVHPELWIGADSKFKKVPMARVYRVSHNKLRTEEEKDRVDERLLKRQEQRKRKLKEAGIDYDFGMVAYKKKPRTSSS